jgi:hypothetical protein
MLLRPVIESLNMLGSSGSCWAPLPIRLLRSVDLIPLQLLCDVRLFRFRAVCCACVSANRKSTLLGWEPSGETTTEWWKTGQQVRIRAERPPSFQSCIPSCRSGVQFHLCAINMSSGSVLLPRGWLYASIGVPTTRLTSPQRPWFTFACFCT